MKLIIYSDAIKKRALTKLGAPVISVEIADEQFQTIFNNSVKDWNLYSTLSNLSEQKLKDIEIEWIESYFQAICKEVLGRIRGKYNGQLPISEVENMYVDFKTLLKESELEKENLINLLIPPIDKIVLAFYINVGTLDNEEIKVFIEKINKSLKEERFYKFFLFPVRGDQETKVECIYPNFVTNEKLIDKFNECLDGIINNIKNEK